MFGVRASSIRPVFSIPSTITTPTYGIAYSETLSITESYVSDLGNYSFVRTSGTLPAGITLTTAAKSFTLSGTPTSKSAFSFTITASLLGKSYAVTYTGTPSVTKITASGGTTYDYGGYRVHVFTALSNFVVSSGCDDVEVMLLSGGGGGRANGNGAGGGGGGGKKIQTALRISGTNAVVIGGGGAAGSAGTASSACGVIGNGGGAGGDNGQTGGTGGSGGGSGAFALSGGSATISGTTGYAGGKGGWFNGGGGGGAGGAGNDGNAQPNETGGYGGSGQVFPYMSGWADPATLVGRGGGGGGGGGANGGNALGGSGGGTGKGNAPGVGGIGTNGDANYGGGGGGGYFTGGNGSTGMVWIRYPL